MPDGVLHMPSLLPSSSPFFLDAKNWLAHWSQGTGLGIPTGCQAYGCCRTAEVGAKVRHIGSNRLIPWIIPFCRYHEKRPREMPVVLKEGSVLYGCSKLLG
ncbi:MAG: hypothetical protein ACI4NJ_09740 [Cellvibrio sp.]